LLVHSTAHDRQHRHGPGEGEPSSWTDPARRCDVRPAASATAAGCSGGADALAAVGQAADAEGGPDHPYRGHACSLIYDDQNTWNFDVVDVRNEGDPPVAQNVNRAYDALGATLEFYRDVLGRNSIDNLGINIIANVNFGVSFQHLRELVDAAGFFSLPARLTAPFPGGDRFRYAIAIETPQRQHAVELHEAVVPPAVRPLLEWLTSAARARRSAQPRPEQ
jgi:hypothetical protein